MAVPTRHRTARLAVVLALSLLPCVALVQASPAAAAAANAPKFGERQAYGVAGVHKRIATGDFDGDGRTDVAVTTESDRLYPENAYALFVLYQQADGTLRRAVRFGTDAQQWDDVMVPAAGDIDGDGRTDLVVRTRLGLNVYLQRDGTFAPRTFLEMPFAGYVRASDLDGDGKADLVMAGGPGITVTKGLGDGTFGPPIAVTGEWRTTVVVGDVTGDGRPDLVTANAFFHQAGVEVFAQRPDGGFGQASAYPTGGYAVGGLAVGDLTGDGRLDVALADDEFDNSITNRVNVFAQTSGGTLAAPVALAAHQPGSLGAADMDGDGRTDLVSVLPSNQIGVFLQRPDGTLSAEQQIPAWFGASAPAEVVDVTGDGRPDVVIPSSLTGVIVLPNATGIPPAPLVPQASLAAWTQPTGAALDAAGALVLPQHEAGANVAQTVPSYLYGQFFTFTANQGAGWLALLTTPAGKYAAYFVRDSRGVDHVAVVPFDWRAGRLYLLYVVKAAPGRWAGLVHDYSAGQWLGVGTFELPIEATALSPTTATGVLWTGPGQTRCSAFPRADVLFHPAIGVAGQAVTIGRRNSFSAAAGDCPAETTASDVWARSVVGTLTA